jgi:hypothetical protein
VDELDRGQRELGWNLPGEAVAWFQWRNGVRQEDETILDAIHFFPGFFPLAFGEALEIRRVYTTEGDWADRWLPIFSNGGGAYKVLDCRRANSQSAPVQRFGAGEPDTLDEYSSLASMMSVIAECFARGAFFVRDGYLEADDEGQAEVAGELDPRVEFWWR